MLNLKKIAALVCTAALTVTALAVSVSAATPELSFTMKNGNTPCSGSSKAGYFTNLIVAVPGMTIDENNYYLTSSGRLEFYVTKGVFTAASMTALGANGIYGMDSSGAPSATFSVTALNDEYDLLSMVYYGSEAYTTDGEDFWEVKLKYAVKADFPTAEFIPKADSSYIVICDDAKNPIGTVSAFKDVDFKYTVKGYENTVTKSSLSSETIPTATEATPVYDGTPANWQGTAATAIGGTYNGVMEGDTAVAYGVGLKGDGNAHTKVIWKVTAKGETKGHEMALNFGGEGTAKVGLAIQGLTAEDNADVSVAFGD